MADSGVSLIDGDRLSDRLCAITKDWLRGLCCTLWRDDRPIEGLDREAKEVRRRTQSWIIGEDRLDWSPHAAYPRAEYNPARPAAPEPRRVADARESRRARVGRLLVDMAARSAA